jgi:hypothetical protein
MAPACRLSWEGRSQPAAWRRDGEVVTVVPEGAPPVAVRLREVSGISGDGFSIALRYGGSVLGLEKLGADGPPLLEALRRDWLPLRARTLRLTAAAASRVYTGSSTEGTATVPFRGFLDGGLLLLCPDGEDVRPFFLARTASIAFSASRHDVTVAAWSGETTTFSRLGAQTQPFLDALVAARAGLAAAAATVVARFLPALDPAVAANLAAAWLPGRLLPLAALEALAPGFSAAWQASWLAGCPRREEGGHLLATTPAADLHLGHGPAPDGAADPDAPPALWLLARRGGGRILELLSHEDHATYLFGDLPGFEELAGAIVSLPHFSREALYLPFAELAGDRADLAVPARDLPALRALRASFSRRVIHASPEAWRREIG